MKLYDSKVQQRKDEGHNLHRDHLYVRSRGRNDLLHKLCRPSLTAMVLIHTVANVPESLLLNKHMACMLVYSSASCMRPSHEPFRPLRASNVVHIQLQSTILTGKIDRA